MAKISIAVVDDNTELLFELLEFLSLRGFHAQGFENGEALLRILDSSQFDLILLDVLLPDQTGYDIAARIRSKRNAHSQVGIIMLTALDSDHHHLQGLNAGADVFLSKHSSLEVIEATCHNLFRRLNAPTSAAEKQWVLYQQQWRLETPSKESIALTHSELVVLAALMQQSGEAVMRTQLLTDLNKPESLSNLRNLDNTVSRLKRKCEQVYALDLPIRPCYGKGYTFTEACVIKTCP